MKNISIEWGFGTDDYDDYTFKEINYINNLENEVFQDKSNTGRFKAELLSRGVTIKGFIKGKNEDDKNLSKLISICKFSNFNEKYCLKMAREIKVPYDIFLSWVFEENKPKNEEYNKISNYFKRKEAII